MELSFVGLIQDLQDDKTHSIKINVGLDA